MAIRSALVALIVMASLVAAPAAWAYSEVATTALNPFISPDDCPSCHSTLRVGSQGPHGGYTTSGRGCAGCHQVHTAPADGYLLLPGATMTETCELCHDGTGGHGVYGTIEARGLTVQSAHRTETSTIVPGGDASTGGSAETTLTGYGGTLSCGDCHTPHGTEPVEKFTRDRMRASGDVMGFYSDQLLKRRPTGAIGDIPTYGSDWCAACHRGRSSGEHELINHPVDTTATAGPNVFVYQSVARVGGANTTSTVMGPMGRSNFGYVMPWPRTAEQGSHSPICQQCHEDARVVGNDELGSIVASEVFTVTSPDGGDADDNPRFQTFPHESQGANLLIEAEDDLCTNCHTLDQLP